MEKLDIEDLNFKYSEPVDVPKIPNYEESILSCLLQKPELFKELTIGVDDFTQYPKLFKYFKDFYDEFGMLDIILMHNKTHFKNRNRLVDIIYTLIDFVALPKHFDHYQDALIEYNREHKAEILTNRLIKEFTEHNISLEEFKSGIDKI